MYKLCVNQLFLLSVRFPVNSGLLIKFLGSQKLYSDFLFNFLSLFIYFERKRKRMCVSEQGRGRERGRDRILSRLCRVSTESCGGLELMNREIMIWAETKSRTDTQPTEPSQYRQPYTQIFYCIEVGAPNPGIVQGSTIYMFIYMYSYPLSTLREHPLLFFPLDITICWLLLTHQHT